MKKMLCLFLSFLMLLSLTACGDSAATQAPGDDTDAKPADGSSAAETVLPEEASSTSEKTKLTILRPGDEKKVRAFLDRS